MLDAGSASESDVIWDASSWRSRPIQQAPNYECPDKVAAIERELSKRPPLVFAKEIRTLERQISLAQEGKCFLFQAGDCAESFQETSANNIRDTLGVMFQAASILTYGTGVPVTKIARIAGQYGKPRSSVTESRDGVILPSYRGDIINSHEFSFEARRNDPIRMLSAYERSAQTLNLVRAFSNGGLADVNELSKFSLDSGLSATMKETYQSIFEQIRRAVKFAEAMSGGGLASPLSTTVTYTSHEALLLNYEQALTREDSLTGGVYDCSAHFLWVGNRTRQLDHAHIEFIRGVQNPIAIKIGQGLKADELKALCEKLNPDNKPGRLSLITRFGALNINSGLPELLRAVRRQGLRVTWICDPMHGNTKTTANGFKTRELSDVLSELQQFIEIHAREGTIPGGIHLEMTGSNVTECMGGVSKVTEETLRERYLTKCDPRLNASQTIELALTLASWLTN